MLRVYSKSKGFDFPFNGTVDELIKELQDHEFPCKVHDLTMNRHYRVSKKLRFFTGRDGKTAVKKTHQIVVSADY